MGYGTSAIPFYNLFQASQILEICNMASIYHYLPSEGASGSVKTKKNQRVFQRKQNLKKIKFFLTM